MASKSASDNQVRGESLIRPHASNHYQISSGDLPLSCPMPGMYLWNSHPKVYLPIEKTGSAKCPYCSASYALVSNDRSDIAGQASQ